MLQRLHTTEETKKTAFVQNLIVEFVNMGMMLSIVSAFNLHSIFMSESAKNNVDVNRLYPGLVSFWYLDVGSVINLTLIINCFWRNIMDL